MALSDEINNIPKDSKRDGSSLVPSVVFPNRILAVLFGNDHADSSDWDFVGQEGRRLPDKGLGSGCLGQSDHPTDRLNKTNTSHDDDESSDFGIEGVGSRCLRSDIVHS